MNRWCGASSSAGDPLLVTCTGFTPKEMQALKRDLLNRNIVLRSELNASCVAVVVRDPLAPPRTRKIRAARENNIPCVTHDWVTVGECSIEALASYELRHAIRKQSVCVMGLDRKRVEELQLMCDGVCHRALTAQCKVLVTPDVEDYRRGYTPNAQKLDFALRHKISCMAFSDFLWCYGDGSTTASSLPPRCECGHGLVDSSHPQSPRSSGPSQRSQRGAGSGGGSAYCKPSARWGTAVAGPAHSVFSDFAPTASAHLSGGNLGRARATPGGMEPMTDVCVYSVAREPTSMHEMAILVEAAGAVLATDPRDPDITHVLLRDEDLMPPTDARGSGEGGPFYSVDASSAIRPRPGVQFVRQLWLLDCVNRRHRVSCQPYRVRVEVLPPSASAAASSTALPVLAFATLSPQETRHLSARIRDARLLAVVQEQVYLRPSGRRSSSRSSTLLPTTHLVVPSNRVNQSIKVQALVSRYAAQLGEIPLVLVDVAWVTESAAQSRWLPSTAFTLAWPDTNNSCCVSSGRPSTNAARVAPLAPFLPPAEMGSQPVPAPENVKFNGAEPQERREPTRTQHQGKEDEEEEEDLSGVAAASDEERPQRKRTRREEPTSAERQHDEEDQKEAETASNASSTAPERSAATPTETTTAPSGTVKEGKSGADRRAHGRQQSATSLQQQQQSLPLQRVERVVSSETCAHSTGSFYEWEAMSMTLQQRWEAMEEALAAHDSSPVAPQAIPGDDGGVLGEDARGCDAAERDGAGELCLAHPRVSAAAPPPPGLGPAPASNAARHSLPVQPPEESQQVFYDHRVRGQRRLDASTDKAPSSLPCSSPSPPVLLFLEGDVVGRDELERRLRQAKPHWRRVESVEECTHYVAAELTGATRLLVSVAQGKWVLQPSFVHATLAAAASEWPGQQRVEEEAHEWTRKAVERLNLGGCNAELAAACVLQRTRAQAAQPAAHRPFSSWRVTLTCAPARFHSFKRVLESGGCPYVEAATADELLARCKQDESSEKRDEGSQESVILSDEGDWTLPQLEAYTAAQRPDKPRVLLVDFIMHFLSSPNPSAERDLLLHRLQKRARRRKPC